MRRTIRGKRCLVTGASSGIGRSLVVQLVKQGADVLATARREDRLAQLRDEIGESEQGGRCEIVAGDILSTEFRSHLMSVVQDQLGGLDILVNNAGAGAVGSFAEAAPERLQLLLDLNVVAPIELIRGALPLLRRGTQPAIVNVGSVLGRCAVPFKSEYCATKFALQGFSDSLRAELHADQIAVLVINPSTTASEFFDQVIDTEPDQRGLKRKAMTSNEVASRIVTAICKNRSETTISFGGKSLVAMGRLLPGLTRYVMSVFARK